MSYHKPAYSSSNVQVKPGFTVPETLLHKLVTENRTAISIVVRTKAAIDIEKHKIEHDVAGTIKFMKQVESNTKNFSRMYCFHSFPAEYDDEAELQPFVLLRDSKKNPLAVVAIEGDFPKYVDTSADGFSEAYKLMDTWLGDKVVDMYKLIGNNPQKIYEYLRAEQFAKDFNEQVGHRGSLSFMLNIGEQFAQEKNDAGVSGDWGQASFAYGYTEPVIQAATPAVVEKVEAPVVPPVKKSRWADDDEPVKEVTPPKVPEKAPETPVEKVAAELPKQRTFTPPANLHGKPLKAWYRNISGDLPKNWAERPDVVLEATTPKASVPKTDTAVADAMKAAQAQKNDKEIVANSMPIVSGDKQKAANEFVKKYIGDGSAIIKDPVASAAMESKLPVFAELMAGSGMKNLNDLQKWTSAFKFIFVKQHPELAALALIQLVNRVRDLELSGDKTLGELTNTEAPIVTTPPVEEPLIPSPVEPVVEPKKVSRWA